MKRREISIETGARDEVVLLRKPIEVELAALGAGDGLVVLHCPHTTAGLAVNEGWDPDVLADFLAALDRVVPWEGHYRHAEGNAAAHVKSVLVGHSVTLPVEGGRLALGRWQDVYFCEFDGPRARTVELRFLPG